MRNTRRRRIIRIAMIAVMVLSITAAAAVFAATFDFDYDPVSRDYVIFDGDKVITLFDCVGGTEEALERAHINTGSADLTVTEDEDAVIITVARYPACMVSCDGEDTLVAMKNATVADVLHMLNIELADTDTLSCDPDEPVSDGMRIKVGRVTWREHTVTEEVPFDTVYLDDKTLERGKTRLKTAGEPGVLTKTYKYTYENGLLVGFEMLSNEITVQPVNEEYYVGTKEPPKPVNKPSVSSGTKTGTSGSSQGKSTSANPGITTAGTGSSGSKDGVHSVTAAVDTEKCTVTAADGTVYTYSKMLTMKATAYTYNSNPAMNITSSGAPVQVGIVAALAKTLPQGTKVYIVGADGTWEYGFATVGDKPGNDIIDLFMESEKQCRNFGVRSAKVYIVG